MNSIRTDAFYSDFEAFYLDGQTPQRQRVSVHPTPSALYIIPEKGITREWPWEEIRQVKDYYEPGRIRLEKGKKVPEALIVPASLFLGRRGPERPPDRRRRFPRPRRWAPLALFSGLGIIAVLLPLYFWGIPGAASLVSAYLPVSWEERLGAGVLEELAPPENQCSDPVRTRKIEEILRLLTSSINRRPYSFRVVVVNHPAVNAFAAPGGAIVVFTGLLDKTSTAEELAGVLAHEIQHILKRHGTRAMLQQLSMGLILTAFSGEPAVMRGAQVVGLLHYSRKYEEEADEGAVRLLIASHIDPRGIIAFFESLQKESGSHKIPTYLSTHPDLGERVQRLKELARNSRAPSEKLLPEYDWKEMHSFCPPAPAS